VRFGGASEGRRRRNQRIEVKLTASAVIYVCGHGEATHDASHLDGDDGRNEFPPFGGVGALAVGVVGRR
jgi:hypothetical protein